MSDLYLSSKFFAKNMMMMMLIILQFFIYLRADLTSQWPITESARIQTTAIRQHGTKQTKTTEKEKWIR
jgi:hypothetical protein